MKNPLKYLRAGALQAIALPQIWDRMQVARFKYVSSRYLEIYSLLTGDNSQGGTRISNHDGYDWNAWSSQIQNAFRQRVPLTFLWHPVIARTMVFGGYTNIEATQKRINIIASVYSEVIARKILQEDYVGLPKITSMRFLTSTNRAQHAYNLVSYEIEMKKSIHECNSAVEWGGGYGDMARIIRRLNNDVTYILIDLPELGALQYIYLYSVEGKDAVNLVVHRNPIIPGRINIIPVAAVLLGRVDVSCDGFISTYGLTESPKEVQQFVLESRFFQADNILLGYKADQYNYLGKALTEIGCRQFPSILVGSGHECAFR